MLAPIHISAGQPRRFGDYVLHRQLGEGGMAFVYEGEEVLSRRPVAVKVLRTELAGDESARRRFANEMAILANFDHPHIVRCLACREIEGRQVLVLERLEGWTLREMLTQRVALPWAEALGYALQIARALDAAHSRTPPVVHRDLKPENVMISKDGCVKVMDFGIAKVLQGMSHATSQAFGTPQYMSPEQIDARGVDARTDLFALGLLLWEMLAGWPPFVADSPRVLLDKVCIEPTPRLPDRARAGLPNEAETLIERLLAKDPNGRPGRASEVVEWLEHILSPGQRTAVTAEPPVRRPRIAAQPVPPLAPPLAPPINTLDIVEAASENGQARVDEYVADAVEIVDRFAKATSALIVRVIMGALLFIPAGCVSACVSAAVAFFAIGLLVRDGVKMPEIESLPWLQWQLGVGLLAIAAVVFVRACWAHRRSLEPETGGGAWSLLGGLSIFAWVALTAIELVPDSNFNATGHCLAISWCTTWLFLTLVWAMGRVTSRMLHNVEQSRAHL